MERPRPQLQGAADEIDPWRHHQQHRLRSFSPVEALGDEAGKVFLLGAGRACGNLTGRGAGT